MPTRFPMGTPSRLPPKIQPTSRPTALKREAIVSVAFLPLNQTFLPSTLLLVITSAEHMHSAILLTPMPHWFRLKDMDRFLFLNGTEPPTTTPCKPHCSGASGTG